MAFLNTGSRASAVAAADFPAEDESTAAGRKMRGGPWGAGNPDKGRKVKHTSLSVCLTHGSTDLPHPSIDIF